MLRVFKRKHTVMLRIDVFLNLAKLPKRLPIKRKKVYGSLVKRKCYNVTTWGKG